MRALIILIALFALPAAAATETRCGWWDNPTPANTWLIDSAGEWTIGTQGDHQAEWADDAFNPSERIFPENEWVATNGSYGYGCACVKADFDPAKKRATYIYRIRSKKLTACTNDPNIKHPAFVQEH